MSFAMPVSVLLLGLGAIAFGLYLLQRLRVRHRPTPVVTTLFWKEAVEESRARVLVRRFRHPWAYALFLAICALLWLAFAQPRSEDDADRHYVLLLDGSANALAGDAFAGARRRLEDDLASLPRDGTRVLFCGAFTRCLLAPGEDPLLLRKRWAGLGPDAAPSTVDEQIRSIANHSDPAHPTTIRIYGPSPVSSGVVSRVPDHVRIERSGDAPALVQNGITALGVSPAASGAWNRVDVYLAHTNNAGFSVTLDDRPWNGEVQSDASVPGAFHLRDVPASGQVLTVRLDALEGPHAEADLVLPARSVIRVRVDGYLRPIMAPVIESDPALTLVERDEDVRIATEETADAGPTLVFVEDGARDPIVVRDAWTFGAADPFADVGLHAIEEIEPEGNVARKVTVGFETGTPRRVSAWTSLLTNRFSLGHSRVFPLFVSTALRWLGGGDDLLRFAAAENRSSVRAARGRRWAARRSTRSVRRSRRPPPASTRTCRASASRRRCSRRLRRPTPPICRRPVATASASAATLRRGSCSARFCFS